MVHARDIIELPAAGLGTRRRLAVHRFGQPGGRPKAYLHAALHAQELPGIVVLDHLIGRLGEVDAAGRVTGEIVVVPFANPVGLAQQVMMEALGRHDLDTNRNYNRGFPAILDGVAAHVDGRLGNDRDANVAMVRAAAAAVLDRRRDLREDDVLKVTLFRLSCDSDFVLDLHTAWEALPHMLITDRNWPDASDLACEMASEVVLVDRGNPMMTFKSAHALLWQGIAERFPGTPLAPGCLPVVLELRGQRDVDDHFTEPAAAGLFRWLQRRGVIEGSPGALPEPRCAARSVSGLRRLLAARGGIVIYLKQLGETVGVGEAFAEILDPESGQREAVTSPVDGLLHARRSHRFVRKGQYFCAIAGDVPSAPSGS